MTQAFFNVRGPSHTGTRSNALWSASIKFKQNQQPAQRWAMQELFVGNGGPNLLVPGTMFGFCIVQSLQITIGDRVLNFSRIGATTIEVPMLLQANPEDWTSDGDEATDQVPECLCLAGQIPVAMMQASDGNRDWTAQFAGLVNGAGNLTATSSGLWISGQAQLPWDSAPMVNPANFHVMVPLPNGGSTDSSLIVELDRDTQSQVSANEFIASFGRLNDALATGGNWVQLELSNPSSIPAFFWSLNPSVHDSSPTNRFTLGHGELSVVLSGGEPGIEGVAQTSAIGSVDPVFTRAADGTLIVQLTGGDRTSAAQAVYTYANSPADESFELKNVTVGYDALTTASVLRQQLGLSDPLISPDPAGLWGCLALEDGWAQLPFLNVTESIYATAFPPPVNADPLAVSTSILSGAAAYGNDNLRPLSEQPWTAVVMDGAGMEGIFTLRMLSGSLTVVDVSATVFDPGVELNGFLWLGNEAPTAADALPSLTNWLAALTMIPLRTAIANDLTPSPWELTFASLSFGVQSDPGVPVLGEWSLAVTASSAFDTLLAAGFFPTLASELDDNPPLLWRRHPNLPAVQSLPLTQSLNPPNYPSPSRQFAPFQLGLIGVKPAGWTFANGAGNGAAAWPRCTSAVTPVAVPSMASLSVPGLSFEPTGAPIPSQLTQIDRFLGVQYHHGLPYLDEIYALSQVTKPGQQGPVTTAALPPPPLDRPSFQTLWDQLAEKAAFAQAEGDAALGLNGSQASVSGLVEPLLWPVAAAWNESAYPGILTLTDANSGSALTLSADSGLEGFSGGFNVHDAATITKVDAAPAFLVTAGSMAAQGAAGKIRDQRGFVRQATTAAGTTVSTPLTSPDGQDWILRSALVTLDLITGADAWKFWFRDLPVKSADGAFVRDRTRSIAARGVNDPAALSPQWVHLSGYEWRMGTSTAKASLPLLGFQFFPLTLEKVEFAADASVHAVEVVGRLLLPGAALDQEANRANSAVLRFEAQAAGMILVAVAAAGIDPDRDPAAKPDASGHAGEWPLDQSGDSARLFWDELALAGNKVQVIKGTLEFIYRGKRWSTPIDLSTSPAVAKITASGTARLDSVELTLDPGSGASPTLFANFVYQFGDISRSFIEVHQRQSLLDATVTGSIALANSAGTILQLNGTVASLIGSVQAEWIEPAIGSSPHDWQLLPGMHLHPSQPIAGFAAMTFGVNGFDAAAPAGAPTPLAVQSAFCESIIRCEWGEMLQEPASDTSFPRSRFFGSSAGSIVAGLSAFFNGLAWEETLLLNGLLEVKSLISWPRPDQALTPSPGTEDFVFTIPAANSAAKPALDHARHTLRVFFDQQEVPEASLVAGNPAAHQVFDFADGQGWQFLAATEHQLVDVRMNPDSTLDPGSELKDCRWTTLQEVRLLTPSLFSNFLSGIEPENTLKHDTDGLQLVSVRDASDLYGGGLLNALLTSSGGLNPITSMSDSLIVEASAAHWIRLRNSTPTGFSPLVFLPGLTPSGAVASLSDYSPSVDPNQPEWMMAVVPFLGRLQAASLDGISADLTQPVPLNLPALRMDPILQIGQSRLSATPLPAIAALLASWEDTQDWKARVSPFELANDPAASHPRRYFRLDPSSLAESWFRVITPPDEVADSNLTSVLATPPVNGPSRLGRPTALARVYENFRASLPPAAPDGSLTLPEEPDGAPVDWRRNRAMLYEGFAIAAASHPASSHDYRLFLAGATLLSADFANAGPNGTTYYPAATVIPTDATVGALPNPMPVTLAVSPYLGFARRIPVLAERSAVPILQCGELLGTQPSGTADILANQLWIADPLAVNPSPIDPTAWANDNIQRIAPDSRIALLRTRKVLNAVFDDEETTATVVYQFDLLTPPAPEQIARVAHPVRTQLQRLRFAEGQYGGPRTPETLRDFEAAPPQIRDVQPLHYERRPDEPNADLWPWGVSALRLRIRAMEAAGAPAGFAAAAKDSSAFWWQAVSHAAQFAVGQQEALQLPPLFRAPAIGSLLPALPDLQLPQVSLLADAPPAGGVADDPWQPMLPGSVDWLADGARPGAGFVFRSQLMRQTGSAGEIVDASGAVPVQHRMPRPVPLRPNPPMHPELALRTWGNFFEPDHLLMVSADPSDTAFNAPEPEDLKGQPEQRKVTLMAPAATVIPNSTVPPVPARAATIPPGWDMTFVLQTVDQNGNQKPAPDTWNMEVVLESQGAVFDFLIKTATVPAVQPDNSLLMTSTWAPKDAATLTALTTDLGRLAHGDALTLTVRVEYVPAAVKGYKQDLVFPLRIAQPSAFSLPLEPAFAGFEDPEYNRGLVSSTSYGEGVWVEPAAPPVPHRIRLSLDRREYNASSTVFAVYVDFAITKLASAFVQASLIRRQDGVSFTLGSAKPVNQAGLFSFSIAKELQAISLTPLPGDILSFILFQDAALKFAIVTVQAAIVANPVTPAPEAAYAFLRKESDSVDCARFAWSPAATRIDLLNPDDLIGETVRRRAVFSWETTDRPNTETAYAIQKVSATGSTHAIGAEEWVQLE